MIFERHFVGFSMAFSHPITLGSIKEIKPRVPSNAQHLIFLEHKTRVWKCQPLFNISIKCIMLYICKKIGSNINIKSYQAIGPCVFIFGTSELVFTERFACKAYYC